jgi:hypothetical protein
MEALLSLVCRLFLHANEDLVDFKICSAALGMGGCSSFLRFLKFLLLCAIITEHFIVDIALLSCLGFGLCNTCRTHLSETSGV